MQAQEEKRKDLTMEKTIRDLVKRVARERRLDLNDDAIVQYQDLIGHATVEENQELANTPELMETFYWIYGAAYGTVAAIKFYLNNSDKIADLQCEKEEYKAKAEKTAKELETARGSIKELEGQLHETVRDMDGMSREVEDLKSIIDDDQTEITRLKALLFDLQEENNALRKRVM